MRQVRLEMADFIIISHTQHHSFILADIKFPKSLLRSFALLTLGASRSRLRWTGRCLDVGTCSLSEPPSRSPSQLHGFLLFFILTVLINILIWLKIKTMRRALDDIGNCKKRLNTLVGRQLWQCFDGNRGLGNLRRRNVRKMSKKSPSKHHFLHLDKTKHDDFWTNVFFFSYFLHGMWTKKQNWRQKNQL